MPCFSFIRSLVFPLRPRPPNGNNGIHVAFLNSIRIASYLIHFISSLLFLFPRFLLLSMLPNWYDTLLLYRRIRNKWNFPLAIKNHEHKKQSEIGAAHKTWIIGEHMCVCVCACDDESKLRCQMQNNIRSISNWIGSFFLLSVSHTLCAVSLWK